MKTDKILQKTTQTIINNVQSTPQAQRVKLTQEPDIVDIPSKKVSPWQKIKNIFSDYGSNLDKTTVKELRRMPFEEFLSRAYEISSDTTGIPRSLMAPVQFVEMNPKLAMTYGMDTNIIEINKNLKTKNRGFIFSLFKHEHRHQLQNFNIMRTEELGEEYIQFLAKAKVKEGIKNFAISFREMPLEKIEELKPQLGESYNWVIGYKNAVAQGEDAEKALLSEIMENDYKVFYEELRAFRAKVIEEMGIIPANSKDAKKSKLHFDSITGSDPTALTSMKTVLRPHELDAYFATAVSNWEFMLARFINKS